MMFYPTSQKMGPMSTGSLSEKPQENIPFLTEPYRAYRCWKVNIDKDPITLNSITYNIEWPIKEKMQADCMANEKWKIDNPHKTPNMSHKCGLYSVKEEFKENLDLWGRGKKNIVFGIVLIWGTVFEYEKGYLSQYAYPLEIYALRGEWELEPEEIIPILADEYGIASDML